jgi:hypothetical protein
MDLKLAMVESCTDDGCRVTLLGDERSVETRYSAPVRDHCIRIRPGQLVAVDTCTETPETVWRWVRTTVRGIDGDRVLVGDDIATVRSVMVVRKVSSHVAIGDEVWLSSTPTGPEVHDNVVDGKPAHIGRLEEYAFPRIIAIYKRLTTK